MKKRLVMGAHAALPSWNFGPVAADPIAVGQEHCVIDVHTSDRLDMRERPTAASPIAARMRHGECGILARGMPPAIGSPSRTAIRWDGCTLRRCRRRSIA